MQGKGLNQHPSSRLFKIITFIYIFVLLILSFYFSITWSNSMDHVKMLFFVGLVIIIPILIALLSWIIIKPQKVFGFLTVITPISFVCILFGSILEKGIVRSFSYHYWSNNGGLLHYITNIFYAILIFLYFLFPYLLGVYLFKESPIKYKTKKTKIFVGIGLAILILFQLFLLWLLFLLSFSS